ncbi:TadE/TadG family type IV pilus assembly protein [Belnapia rosea]|uniref:TadE/TadG family type IV pilus assembly protein n=1 Tax=Belnapia rosea TaxID=938405 RepID=UPI00088AE333|nr:TadE family protein [Belnapia rosea]SDB74470.1 TadE-like protein [Belnapia rosea]
MRRKLGSRGVAASELAVMAPVLLLLFVGTADVANLIQTNIRLDRAVQAGAQYAAGNETDLAGIQAQVMAAWPELTAADVPLPILACECAGTAIACDQACPSGLVQTVAISAQRSLSPQLLTGFGRGTGRAVVRIR